MLDCETPAKGLTLSHARVIYGRIRRMGFYLRVEKLEDGRVIYRAYTLGADALVAVKGGSTMQEGLEFMYAHLTRLNGKILRVE